jgi:catechol 2,3-dioxygenase-like lactoylglutathione lyase family enzyme
MRVAARPAAHFRTVAFVIHPVKDVKAARAFYEDTLGLTVTKQWENDWVEYDIGAGTLVITAADEKHHAGRHGPTLAIEVTDLAALVPLLQQAGVTIVDGPFDSPPCRGCVIRDLDGNQMILHQTK